MKRKPLSEIYDELDDAFKKAEKELIENYWATDEVNARERMFVELVDMFGAWHKKGDCLPLLWMKEVYGIKTD